MPTRSSSPIHRSPGDAESHHAYPTGLLDLLRKTIEHLAHLLPAQGPITVFVHHNTLHAFEHLPFEKAVEVGTRRYGGRPYLPEDRYRDLLTSGRIRAHDVREILREELADHAPETVLGETTRLELRYRMLESPLHTGSVAELHWLMAETDALRRFRPDLPASVRRQLIETTRHWILRDIRPREPGAANTSLSRAARRARQALTPLLQRLAPAPAETWSDTAWEELTLHALWQACRRGLRAAFPQQDPPAIGTPSTGSGASNSDDTDHAQAEELLIRFCAAFLDQGLAGWRLPGREHGFYRAFFQLYGQPGGPPVTWMANLARELRRVESAGLGPLESIAESLQLLGVEPAQSEEALFGSLSRLRGWAGMIWQLETRGDRVPFPAPPGTLVEYVAIRMLIERAVRRAGHSHPEVAASPPGTPSEVGPKAKPQSPERSGEHRDQLAFLCFQVAQLMGWSPEALFSLSRQGWRRLAWEIETFPASQRQRVFHLAFERRYRQQALDALAVHAPQISRPRQRPRLQVVCCIDDREESFRRHLEESAPDVETFGTAGFFGTAMYYRGAAEAHFTPLCPIVMRPHHWVVEDIACSYEDQHVRRMRTRRMIGSLSRQFHFGSRTLWGGALTALVGSLATVPLVAEVLFPRLTARFRRLWGKMTDPPPVRQLILERSEPEPGSDDGHIGFTIGEMADIVRRVLEDIGLTGDGARLVIIFGHGSSSANNPHESAYNCGACAGSRGGPNARAFAHMANDARVQTQLVREGLRIPADQYFLGAYHNTCDDSVVYYDLDRLPTTHRKDLQQATQDIETARRRNAHERCRRFESAPLDLSDAEALRHVEHRADNLAQTRPEYNHASNALTFVGRRSRTRGLFLDRRAFLVSYDPTRDDADRTILARTLRAVVPVCAGISLEYYFSTVDPTGYGCDNKLPHNITSLLGVMLGASSDLQPGLNTQMTEIHEPMRPLVVIEATPDALRTVLAECPQIEQLIRNQWIQLAVLDPEAPIVHVWKDGQFVRHQPETTTLPSRGCSADWYRGWREHLGFAEIVPQPLSAPESPPAAAARVFREPAPPGTSGPASRPLAPANGEPVPPVDPVVSQT
jgi:uncharacterized protein